MQTSKLIRNGFMLAGLIVGFTQAMNAAEEHKADWDVEGRQVSLKPIYESRPGGDGGNEWILASALGALALIVVGGLVSGKLIDDQTKAH
jgi:hypothetical protein